MLTFVFCACCRYCLHGKIRNAAGRTLLSFDLEVCLVGPARLVGVRRKRVRGDAWCYRRVCEEVLALAAQQHSPPRAPLAACTSP